jgi:hypothetical protein
MSAPLTFSAELAASVQRMKERTWRDADAAAYEQGDAPTRPAAARPTAQSLLAAGARQIRELSRLFPRKKAPRSPDRQKSRERRRKFGSDGTMPPAMRAWFTEGERSPLAVIAGHCKHHGVCELPIDRIAAQAGVCRTTVQNAVHEARRRRLIHVHERPQRGARSLTNQITIISPEWKAWLARGSQLVAEELREAAELAAACRRRPATETAAFRAPQMDGRIGSKIARSVSTTKSTASNDGGNHRSSECEQSNGRWWLEEDKKLADQGRWGASWPRNGRYRPMRE